MNKTQTEELKQNRISALSKATDNLKIGAHGYSSGAASHDNFNETKYDQIVQPTTPNNLPI